MAKLTTEMRPERAPFKGEDDSNQLPVRWARLIVWEGPADKLRSVKEQSLFNTSRKMGGVTCIVLDASQLQYVESVIDLHPKETT